MKITPQEATETYKRLKELGVVFSLVPLSLPNEGLIPRHTELQHLAPDSWAARWVPTFLFLPSDHPDAAFMDECRNRFFADPEFAAAIENAADEEKCAELDSLYDSQDWEIPQ